MWIINKGIGTTMLHKDRRFIRVRLLNNKKV